MARTTGTHPIAPHARPRTAVAEACHGIGMASRIASATRRARGTSGGGSMALPGGGRRGIVCAAHGDVVPCPRDDAAYRPVYAGRRDRVRRPRALVRGVFREGARPPSLSSLEATRCLSMPS